MRTRICLTALAAACLLAGPAGATEPDVAPALALLPEEAVAFFHVPSLSALEKGLKHFADQTGWTIGKGERPILDLLARRTGLVQGIDPTGSVCIGFLDPKRFRQRYTIYVLPVSDWDALLKSSRGEVMSPGLYALMGVSGPRFVARRGKFAVVTSSIRTMDAVLGARSLIEALPAETVARAVSDAPMLYLNVDSVKTIYESEIASWFRASSGQVYDQPNAVPYADMLVTYMLGIASFIDQMETVEAALKFEPEGLAADLKIRFVDGAAVADFLSAQAPGILPIPAVTEQPVSSAVTFRLNPARRTDFALRATRFFLESAPRPEPLPESTKKTVYEAVQVFAESLGDHITFLSAPAQPGMGVESGVAVYELVDPERFRHGVELLAASWEGLADQLDLYLKFKALPDTTDLAGVPVVTYVPRLRFGIPARHVEFRQRLRMLYGPEGMVYRVAVVGNYAVVATGSDLTVFRKAIEQLQKADGPAPSPAMRRLYNHISRDENLLIALSLPVYLGQSLARGGTAADRIGTVDPGHEVIGFGVRFGKAEAEVTTYLPHEQIRLARELLSRALPEATDIPESLFKPAPEGPPGAGVVPLKPLFPPDTPVVPPTAPNAESPPPIAAAPAPRPK